MLIGILIFLGLAVLILAHEFGHFISAKLFGMRVDEFGLGFPPRLWTKKIGETQYSFNLIPFGGFVKIAGENDGVFDKSVGVEAGSTGYSCLFYAQPAWRRSGVILAGVAMNFILGWVLISSIFMIGTAPSLAIGTVEPNSPAAQAGILPGDMVQDFRTTQEFIDYVHARAGTEIEFHIERNGEAKTFHLTPRAQVGPNQGPIGVVFAGIPRLGIWESLQSGLELTVRITKLTFVGFGQLLMSLFRHGTLPADVVGPVGIFSIAQTSGQMGVIYLVELLAFISINLGALNLIPFPALDGGRFALILIEKIKGSPIPHRIEAWVNGVGFSLLILLMIALTVRDVIRL